MDRKIVVEINGSYLRKDNKIAGVQGEGNSTYLNLIFDEGWSGLAKKITFWNAKGMNPVEITLTADHLTNMSTSLLDYTVPIPPEPLEFDGEMEYVIDGYKDGVRVRSLADKMVVKYAPVANNAGTPTDPTPTQAEQLQEQIDTMLSDMQAERIKAETAASTSQSAAETSLEAKDSAESAAQTAITKAGEASDSADAAKISEENAKQSEINAKASEESAASDAQTATNKASEAVQASEEAVSAKNAAATSEENAKTSETKAKQSETNAKSSEETAVAAKDEAVAAKNSAETAEKGAIAAKTAAEIAQQAAETARDQAQEIAGGDYATRAEFNNHTSNTDIHVTADEKASWNEKDVFIATYGTTTSAEIEEAYQAGKVVKCTYNDIVYLLDSRLSSTQHVFSAFYNFSTALGTSVYFRRIVCSDDSWSASVSLGMYPANHASKHSSEGSDPITPSSIGAAYKPTISTSTMSASGWSDGVYSFESSYPVATYDIEVEIDGDSCTAEQLKVWNSAQIVGSSTTNSCKALGDVPTIDIPIIIKAVVK